MAKKMTRKQLLKEPDEFLTFSHRLMRYVLEHKMQIAGGLAILFAIVIVVSAVGYFSEKAEYTAFALMNEGKEKYDRLSEAEGPESAYRAVESDFQEILNRYADKDGGKLARIMFGDIAFEAGDFDKAIELYEAALREIDGFPSFRNLIYSSLGYAYEGKGDPASAIRYFEMIASGSNSLMKSEAWFNLGRIYAETGEMEKSRRAYETLLSDYPDATYVELARERVAKSG